MIRHADRHVHQEPAARSSATPPPPVLLLLLQATAAARSTSRRSRAAACCGPSCSSCWRRTRGCRSTGRVPQVGPAGRLDSKQHLLLSNHPHSAAGTAFGVRVFKCVSIHRMCHAHGPPPVVCVGCVPVASVAGSIGLARALFRFWSGVDVRSAEACRHKPARLSLPGICSAEGGSPHAGIPCIALLLPSPPAAPPSAAAGETALSLLLQSPACDTTVPMLRVLLGRGADAKKTVDGVPPLVQVGRRPGNGQMSGPLRLA